MNSATYSEGMNVTTETIQRFRQLTRRAIEARDPLILEIEAENEAAAKLEVELINKRSSVCTPGLSDKLAGKVDMKKLASDMGDQFLNYDYMRAAACEVYATFHGISEATSNVAQLARVKSHVRNLHKIGEESAYGYALTGDIDGAKDLFVLKTARTKEGETDLNHELVVGIILNQLRKIAPNGALLFGGFKCSGAIIDHNTGKVESYCSSEVGQVPYVIYENISPSESFGKVAMKCTVSEFYGLLGQHLLFTHIASELVGYTHYDCHPGNCLVREVHVDGIEGKFCIPYTVNQKTNTTWYVEATKVLTMIDYGMTSVDYQGVSIGAGDIRLEEFGVTAGPWPLHDAYKLLGFVALSLIKSRSNPKVLEEIRKIFTFFNKEERLEDAILAQDRYGTYFSLPKMKEIENFTILDLLDHILEVGDVGNVFSREPQHPVLECTSCYSFSATIEGTYIRDPVPTNFFDFYEVAKHLGSTSKISYDRVVNSFNYDKAATEFKQQVSASIEEMKQHLANEHLPELSRQPTVRDLTERTTYRESQDAYIQLVSAISHYEDIRVWLSVGNAVAILFADQTMINFINKERQALSDTREVIVARINEIREFYRKISLIVSSQQWDRYKDKYPWYTVNSGEIISLRDRFAKDERELFIEHRLPSTIINSRQKPRREVRDDVVRSAVPPTTAPVQPRKRRVAVIRNSNGLATGLDVSRR